MKRTELKQWLSQRASEDDELYERFGRELEAQHTGEFVAISREGRVIQGTDELEVARQAVKMFGEGKFALRRLGAEAEIRWRRK